MNTNEKASQTLDQKNNDEAIVELTPAEANAVAGGTGSSRPPDLNPSAAGNSGPPDLNPSAVPASHIVCS
ncbi:MAG TPA: hypothetical protein PK156_13975 [Polyangium sp.]|nr:hypothetical protein [Polyangium sp.]